MGFLGVASRWLLSLSQTLLLPHLCATVCRLENTLNYGMERVWALGYVKGTNSIAVG